MAIAKGLWPVDVRTKNKIFNNCATTNVTSREIFKAIYGSKEMSHVIEGERARCEEEAQSRRGKGSQLSARGNPEVTNEISNLGAAGGVE